MPLQSSKKVLLAKIESVYGTDPTPTGGANAILVTDVSVSPLDAEIVERNLIRPYPGNSDRLVASAKSSIEFSVEIAGAGAAGSAPGWGPLMKACGFAETLTASTSAVYAPKGGSYDSVTMYFFVDGVRHKMTGARGSVEFTINARQIPVARFTFTGLYSAPSDTSNPSADFSAFQQPRVANTTNTTSFSLLSYSGKLDQMSLNMANQIEYRSLIGGEEVLLVDRKPEGTFVIEAPTIAAKDYWTAGRNGTTGTMSILHGTVAGNRVQIDCARVVLQNPTYQQSQGVEMLSIPFVATPVTGNDEVTITVT